MTSISVIISAYNEENNIQPTIRNVRAALEAATIDDYEILVFDDASTDETSHAIAKAQGDNSKIKHYHNENNMGFGYAFFRGMELAIKDYVVIFPGDNEISLMSMISIFKQAGKADIIIPHTINMEARPYGRRLLSRLFTLIVNAIFRCELSYYNGPCLYKREILRDLPLKTNSFTFGLITLVPLILQGYSFMEIQMQLTPKDEYKSSALKFKNICKVLWSVIRLTNYIYGGDLVRRKTKRVFCE